MFKTSLSLPESSLFGEPYEAKFQSEGTGSAVHVYDGNGDEVLTYTAGAPIPFTFIFFNRLPYFVFPGCPICQNPTR